MGRRNQGSSGTQDLVTACAGEEQLAAHTVFPRIVRARSINFTVCVMP